MRRLQSDHIDLYQLHSPPREELTGTRLQDALGLLARLKTEGKIREYGIALDSVYDAAHCLDMEGIASLQMPFGSDGPCRRWTAYSTKCPSANRDHRARLFRWRRVETVPHRGGSACNGAAVGTRFADQAARRADAALSARSGAPVLALHRSHLRHHSGDAHSEHVATNLQYYAARPLSDEEKRELLAR